MRETVEVRIDAAKGIYERHGKMFMSNSSVRDLVRQYRVANMRTQCMMADLGIVEACTACATSASGSCCFCGVEDWYDHVLLLVNLLLGSPIPRQRGFSDACLFVGPKGCLLMARHAFCVNYLCPTLTDRLSKANVKELLSTAGHELYLGWELERWIRNRLGEQEGPR